MKLTEKYFIPLVTDNGVSELYSFVDTVLYKYTQNIPKSQRDDVRQEMIVKCLEKLREYDASRGIPLGGFLYWQCRGVVSVWANKHRHEVPVPFEKINLLAARRNNF